MPCCLLCFDDSPVVDNPRELRANKFDVSMLDTLTINQPVCLLAYCFGPCCAFQTRMDILDGNIERYICCQGYYDNRCCKAGTCGEKSCPFLCLGLESCCCLGPSVSATRMYVADT